MKRFSLVFLFMMMLCGIMAQSPEQFSYQAVVRNANNTLVTGTQVGVRVSVLQGSAAGAPVYVETHTVTTNTNGLMTLAIGDGTILNGTFSDIDWSDGPYFLKTEIDPTGGSNYTITSTQQLLSVPYALYAKTAGNAFSGDYNDLTNTPDIPTVPANLSAFTNDASYLSVAQCPDVDICALMSQLETLQQQVAALQSQVDSLINVADTSNNQNVPTDTTLIVTFTTADMTEPMIAPNQSEWTENSFIGIRGYSSSHYRFSRLGLTNDHYMVFDSVDYISDDELEHTVVYTNVPCTISEIRLFSQGEWVDMTAAYQIESSADGRTHVIKFIYEIEVVAMAVKIQRLH